MIYGLNLWHGTPENAAAEAAYVFKTLGRGSSASRSAMSRTWITTAGLEGSLDLRPLLGALADLPDAVKKAVPGARFAGPDIAKEYDWVTKMADKQPDIEFLSGHYYAEGPPADPKMTLEFLLKRGKDPAAYGEIAIVQAATKSSAGLSA